jgi:hypothetical protein
MSKVYRVRWHWHDSPAWTVETAYCQIIDGYSTVDDIPMMIAARELGKPDMASAVRIIDVVEVETITSTS